MKKIIQLSTITNQLKKEYWINPFLDEAKCQMFLRLGREDAPFSIISDPMIGCETSQVARNFASWHCIEGHWLDTKEGRRLVKPDYLMMLDSDMSTQVPGCWLKSREEKSQELLELVKHADEKGYPVFGAVYPGYKYQEWFLHVYNKNKFSDALYDSYTVKELMEWAEKGPRDRSVDAIGTGAIVIKREVLEAVAEHNKKRGVIDPISGQPVIFERGRDNIGRTFHGEDLLFCSRAKELGFEVWTSLDFLYGHDHLIPMLEIPAWDQGGSGLSAPDWSVEDYGLPKDWKLPEITRWSMTPGGCNILREVIDKWCDESEEFPGIIEFGPGISSLVIDHQLQLAEVALGHRFMIENNIGYANYLGTLGLLVHTAELINGFYAFDLDSEEYGETHLIIVDGPPSHEGTRRPAMYKCWEHWAVGGYLVLDDAQREPERTIVEEWKAFYGDRVSLEVKDDGYGRQLAVFKKEKG